MTDMIQNAEARAYAVALIEGAHTKARKVKSGFNPMFGALVASAADVRWDNDGECWDDIPACLRTQGRIGEGATLTEADEYHRQPVMRFYGENGRLHEEPVTAETRAWFVEQSARALRVSA